MGTSETMTQFPHLDIEFSDDDLRELEKARQMPITFDEDCPETTPERAQRFKRINPRRPQCIAEEIRYTGQASQ